MDKEYNNNIRMEEKLAKEEILKKVEDKVDNQIDTEAYHKFMESKKYFSKFNAIYEAPMTSVDISKADLPTFTEEENAKNIKSAYERLYGKSEE